MPPYQGRQRVSSGSYGDSFVPKLFNCVCPLKRSNSSLMPNRRSIDPNLPETSGREPYSFYEIKFELLRVQRATYALG